MSRDFRHVLFELTPCCSHGANNVVRSPVGKLSTFLIRFHLELLHPPELAMLVKAIPRQLAYRGLITLLAKLGFEVPSCV